MSLFFAEEQVQLTTNARAAISISNDISRALSVCGLELF